ncbi:MAG: redoxin domain-containing protein [Alphaproteobacteria bacterium]
MSSPFGVITAPAFPTDNVSWLNTEAPLTLDQLRGKLIILDFWTFCCINCMHILPTLRALEEEFADDLVVIGVHTPKFASEHDEDNVAQAIARYDIRHPVLHDPGYQTWQAYTVRAWPTLVFVSPDGKVIGNAPGEPDPDKLKAAVGDLIARGKSENMMAGPAFPFQPPANRTSTFSFPGKIKPTPARFAIPDAHMIVADGGHHQIAALDKNGQTIKRFGSGTAGFHDGAGADASFRDPQGFAVTPAAIYVADTGNHALRKIDLVNDCVTTLAGNGKRGMIVSAPQQADQSALASPWDLEHTPMGLAIANAGTHQLLLYHEDDALITPLAGTGGEDIVDGPALNALLAQPSGLYWNDASQALYFADSETSAIRALKNNQVETLVGTGLFDFGHVNGDFTSARLQHALGLFSNAEILLVADSYNHVIRQMNIADQTVSDWDDGMTCLDPVCLPLAEPAGICVDNDGAVYLSDTNNHRLLRFDPAKQHYQTWSE